ncbi:MAG: polyprenyl synthetase family protein [Peptococcaceae bacterium]|nr:polyprenyl synthetase family protein [Peptococcaceae bacterium]
MKQLWLFKEISGELDAVEKRLEQYVRTDQALLSQTSIHLLAAGGKRLRPAFVLLVAKLFNAKSESVMSLAMALELIHMASLVHDDVVDAALTRRGRPTVRANWGNQISVHTGDHLFAKSLLLIAEIDNPEISRILAEVSIQMSEGEIQQIKSTFDVQQLPKDYYYRIKRKTALLISASCKLSAIACNGERRQIWALGAYGHALGMAFQIVDDILDLTADQTQLGKPIGGDLRQGIITLPMIYALQQSSQASRLSELIALHTKSEQQIQEAIAIITASGAIAESLRLVQQYVDKSKQYLQEVPAGSARKALEQLADFIMIRKY